MTATADTINRSAWSVDQRIEVLAGFMGLTQEDIDTIHEFAPILASHAPALVNAVYVKLFSNDLTKRHFMTRGAGYEGPLPEKLDDLTLDHPQILMRKQHLGAYLGRLVTSQYDSKMNAYLDMVGKIHTAKAGSPDVVIPLVQMNALMGFVHDALIGLIFSLPAPECRRVALARAFTKLLWIQGDLISRHYTPN